MESLTLKSFAISKSDDVSLVQNSVLDCSVNMQVFLSFSIKQQKNNCTEVTQRWERANVSM